MSENGRFESSVLNLLTGILYRVVIMATAFVVRTVFLKCLNTDYLGVNGLYSNILSMLSLAELGFGTAMVYSMYRPLAVKDYEKLRQLMQLYKKVYIIIGWVILSLGVLIIPFLDSFIKDQPDVDGLTLYYVLFLLNTVFSYWFFAYQNAILNADQKAYIISKYHTIFNMIKSLLQIVVLVCFREYFVYLLIQILSTIAQNVCIALKVRKIYPKLSQKSKTALPKKEVKRIYTDVKALMISRVAHVVLNSTDNIIISALIGVKWVGLLSNFYIITEAVTGILTQFTSAVTASLGNYFVKEDRKSGYALFKRIEFMNFWLYGFSFVALSSLMNPFVELWLGETYRLDAGIVIALSVNFLVAGFMNTLWTFRSTLGLFTQGKYRPLIVAALNILFSIVLGHRFAVTGVLIATAISRACVNLWYDPWILHKHGFKESVKSFYISYVKRIIVLIGIVFAMNMVSKTVFIGEVTILSFAIMVLLTVLIPNGIFLLVFHRTEEFHSLYEMMRNKLFIRFVKRK